MKDSFNNMFEKPIPWFILITVCFGFFLYIPYAHAQPTNFTLDFETGDLRGWTKTGNAFDYQPTPGDNPTARNRGQPSNHQGRYWIGTYEKYQGRPDQKPGNIQGDRPQGTLTSAPFTIPSGKLSFLVGGGSSFETRVEFLVRDPIEGSIRVFHASGRNTETMHRVEWNLSPYEAKTGQIRIVDASSGEWGHINADDFRFTPAAGTGTASLHLRLENSPPFQVGRPIRFSVRTEPEYPGIEYKFYFGDGSISDWMRENATEHLYSKEGAYHVIAWARSTMARDITSRRPKEFTAKSNVISIQVQEPSPQSKVYLEVDRDHVRTGEKIRFKTAVRPSYQNIEYQFDFGDGKKSNWITQSAIEYYYLQKGTYKASVTAKTRGARLVGSNFVTIEVEKIISVPVAKIRPERQKAVQGDKAIFESRSLYDPDGWINENWIGPDGRRGKGRSFEVNTGELKPGNYEIVLEIIDNHLQRDRAVGTLVVSPPVKYTVNLEADHNKIEQNRKVKFKASIIPVFQGAVYIFNFGDGKVSEWTSESKIEHIYSSPGIYQAFVTVRREERVIAESSAVQVEITRIEIAPADYKVFLDAEPNRAEPGKTIFFRARIEPYIERAEYRFIFGDGESRDWSNEATAEHSYSKPGYYRAYVAAHIDRNIILETNPVMLTIIKLHKIPWILIIAGSLLILGGGYYLFSRIKKPEKTIKDVTPEIQIKPHRDTGIQQIESDTNIQSDLEIRLKPILDHGKQDIEAEGSLIIDERRDHE